MLWTFDDQPWYDVILPWNAIDVFLLPKINAKTSFNEKQKMF